MPGQVGVIGAGLMGSEIALSFALAGYDVLLNDRDGPTVEKARGRLETLMTKGVARGFFQEADVQPALSRLRPGLDLGEFGACSMVTEAIFESAELKLDLFGRLDTVCRPDCIIATNTSTIPISTLAAAIGTERRGRFVGTHYFSPVTRMKLVEVIPGFATDSHTLATVMSTMTEIGKSPILVKDVPGFAVNRMLHMFIIEAVKLVEEGVATPEDIDKACRLGLGHPIGPFALMDAVTSTLCVQAQEIMQEAYGERFRPPPLLKQRVRAGYGGGKGRPGWLKPDTR